MTDQLVRRRGDAVAVAGGVLFVGAGMLAVRNGTVSSTEETIFRAVNDLPRALYPGLWPFQQLGVVVVGPIVSIAALVARRYRLAIAALVATAAKLGLERVVKSMVTRERPATSIGADIKRRGDVPLGGESFVSGHALLVAALACLVAPYLRGRWRLVPWVAVALVMVTRVYVGAHNPLDVVCGAALGVAIGSLLNLVLGAPRTPTAPPSR